MPEWEFLAFAAFAALAWLWYDSMRARERAVAAGQAACVRERLQFLDETVECTSVRPARNEAGQLVLRRGNHCNRKGSIVSDSTSPESMTICPERRRLPSSEN